MEEYVYTTKKSINEWRKKVESRSTLECLNLSQLSKSASLEEMQEAKRKDKMFFEGFISDLESVL